MGKLTAKAFRAVLKKPGKHGDGDGLFLQVTPAGAGSERLATAKAITSTSFGVSRLN